MSYQQFLFQYSGNTSGNEEKPLPAVGCGQPEVQSLRLCNAPRGDVIESCMHTDALELSKQVVDERKCRHA
ncbi:hypothetical protein DPMN_019144 [Dreissena polymorpha]|uniref:Uncharacterized protein n=1 Tax=Dreissena polymorpha TaxID=45954 RepID=A0A9D4NJT9_DREPO|nr:hypothetical protein DPMN_019144 [Dreissena polymorpha]